MPENGHDLRLHVAWNDQTPSAGLDQDQQGGEESDEDAHHHGHHPVLPLGGAELRHGVPLAPVRVSPGLLVVQVLSAQARVGLQAQSNPAQSQG